VLPSSGQGFLPYQPKNSAADEKIRPHTIFSKKKADLIGVNKDSLMNRRGKKSDKS
jgi:hypothetical protein